MTNDTPPDLAAVLDALAEWEAELAELRAEVGPDDREEVRCFVEAFEALRGPLTSKAVQ